MRDYLAAIEHLPSGSVEQIIGQGPAVILAPHADDETLGCGGLIAMAHARGHHLEVVVMTDGTGSHPNSKAFPPARLAAVRRDEARAAAQALGLPPGRVTFLELKDTAAPMSGPDFDRVVDQVETLVRAIGAQTLLVTWRHDPHCDHEAAALVAEAVLRRNPHLRGWCYPIWGLHRPPDDLIEALPPAGLLLDIAPALSAKRTALACHASQTTALIADDPDGFRLSETHLAPFLRPVERFLAIEP